MSNFFGRGTIEKCNPQLVGLRFTPRIRGHCGNLANRLPQWNHRGLLGRECYPVDPHVIDGAREAQAAARTDAQRQLEVHGPVQVIEQHIQFLWLAVHIDVHT